MKNKFYLHLKKILLITLGCIILSFMLYSSYISYQEKVFINYCIEMCLHDIYNYVTQEDSKIFYGTYTVHIDTEKTSLASVFYKDYIVDKKYIMIYLETLAWKDIILVNNGNTTNIQIDVRQCYIDYIKIQENAYTLNLLQNIDLITTKEFIKNILQMYVENLNINTIKKEIIISDTFITEFLESIEWNVYIRTVEFRDNDFKTIIKFYYNKIQNIDPAMDINNPWYVALRNFLLVGHITSLIYKFYIPLHKTIILMNQPNGYALLLYDICRGVFRAYKEKK